jgi:hypothetical protein
MAVHIVENMLDACGALGSPAPGPGSQIVPAYDTIVGRAAVIESPAAREPVCALPSPRVHAGSPQSDDASDILKRAHASHSGGMLAKIRWRKRRFKCPFSVVRAHVHRCR